VFGYILAHHAAGRPLPMPGVADGASTLSPTAAEPRPRTVPA